MVVVAIQSPNDFYQLDSSNYVNNIQKSFNKLDNVDLRKNLEKKIENYLRSENTAILKSSDLYPVNAEISFSDFVKTIKESGAEAVLLINQKGSWNSSSYFINGNVISQEDSPHLLFLGYLIDLKYNKPVWIAKSVVNGTVLTGYEALNANFANRVANKLSKGYYIYAKMP